MSGPASNDYFSDTKLNGLPSRVIASGSEEDMANLWDKIVRPITDAVGNAQIDYWRDKNSNSFVHELDRGFGVEPFKNGAWTRVLPGYATDVLSPMVRQQIAELSYGKLATLDSTDYFSSDILAIQQRYDDATSIFGPPDASDYFAPTRGVSSGDLFPSREQEFGLPDAFAGKSYVMPDAAEFLRPAPVDYSKAIKGNDIGDPNPPRLTQDATMMAYVGDPRMAGDALDAINRAIGENTPGTPAAGTPKSLETNANLSAGEGQFDRLDNLTPAEQAALDAWRPASRLENWESNAIEADQLAAPNTPLASLVDQAPGLADFEARYDPAFYALIANTTAEVSASRRPL